MADRQPEGAAPVTSVQDDVSVILIVRNGERFIAEAIESVWSGTCVPGELLVIDGDSSDRTVEIARAFRGVTVIPQVDRGIANAYNQGIAAARGDYVGFISHDDLWMPEKLELQLAYMRARPGLMYTVTHVQEKLLDGMEAPPGFREELLRRPVAGFIMETLLARREVFTLAGHFDSSFAVGEDTDWYARARDLGIPMGILPQTLVVKRVHDANVSFAQSNVSSTLLRVMRRSIERKRARANGA